MIDAESIYPPPCVISKLANRVPRDRFDKIAFGQYATSRLSPSRMGKTYSEEAATTWRADLKEVSGDNL
jgi:hypothetical protein